MAPEPTLRRFAEQISIAIREFSKLHGWPAGDYRVYFRFNEDWSTAHVILAADHFGESEPRDQMLAITKFLDGRLQEFLKYVNSFYITMRTFSQIREGGIYEISPEFVDVDELLASKVRQGG